MRRRTRERFRETIRSSRSGRSTSVYATRLWRILRSAYKKSAQYTTTSVPGPTSCERFPSPTNSAMIASPNRPIATRMAVPTTRSKGSRSDSAGICAIRLGRRSHSRKTIAPTSSVTRTRRSIVGSVSMMSRTRSVR